MFCANKATSENRDYCVTKINCAKPSFIITPDQGVQKPIIILC